MAHPPSPAPATSPAPSPKKSNVYVISDSSDDDSQCGGDSNQGVPLQTEPEPSPIVEEANVATEDPEQERSRSPSPAAEEEVSPPANNSQGAATPTDNLDLQEQRTRSHSPPAEAPIADEGLQPHGEQFHDISAELTPLLENEQGHTQAPPTIDPYVAQKIPQDAHHETAKDANIDIGGGEGFQLPVLPELLTPKLDEQPGDTDVPPDSGGLNINIDAVDEGGRTNDDPPTREQIDAHVLEVPNIAEEDMAIPGATQEQQLEIKDVSVAMLPDISEEEPRDDIGGMIDEAFTSAEQNVDEFQEQAGAEGNIQGIADQEHPSELTKGDQDIEMHQLSSSAPLASPSSTQKVSEVICLEDDDTDTNNRGPQQGTRRIVKQEKQKKHPAYEARMDLARRFGGSEAVPKKKTSVTSSSSSHPSASSESSLYLPEGGHGRDKDRSGGDINRKRKHTESSSAPQGKPKQYISINMRDGVVRKALILEYLPDVKMHFVRFMDDEGGSERLKLSPHNHRKLNAEEMRVLEEELGASMKADINDLTRPPRSRIQPKRRPRPRNLLPQPARPEKKSKPVYVTKPVPAEQADEDGPGYELVGGVIAVRWPVNGANYVALVVGFRKAGKDRKHKLFYVCDESTEEIDLRKRDWKEDAEECKEWDRSGLVSKRIYVMWQAEYENENKEECENDDDENVPFEAFVVKYINEYTYRILYTVGDQLEDRDMREQPENWELCEPGIWEHDGLPIVSWSTREETSVTSYRENDLKKKFDP